jgi:hypothetical protein
MLNRNCYFVMDAYTLLYNSCHHKYTQVWMLNLKMLQFGISLSECWYITIPWCVKNGSCSFVTWLNFWLIDWKFLQFFFLFSLLIWTSLTVNVRSQRHKQQPIYLKKRQQPIPWQFISTLSYLRKIQLGRLRQVKEEEAEGLQTWLTCRSLFCISAQHIFLLCPITTILGLRTRPRTRPILAGLIGGASSRSGSRNGCLVGPA